MTVIFHVEGKMSTFGGPHDTGMKPDEGLALFDDEQDMKAHGLGDYLLSQAVAGAPGLGRRLNPAKYYLACRWWDAGLSRKKVRSSWAWVENPKTGKRHRARPVDYGPAPYTGRVADLSPGLAQALALRTDDICRVILEEQGAVPLADIGTV